jgi:hypothetical protein
MEILDSFSARNHKPLNPPFLSTFGQTLRNSLMRLLNPFPYIQGLGVLEGICVSAISERLLDMYTGGFQPNLHRRYYLWNRQFVQVVVMICQG